MSDLLKNLFLVIAVPFCIAVVLLGWWLFVPDRSITIARSLSFALIALPLFLPFLLFYITFDRWMEFVRTQFLFKSKRVTLRIKLPQEVFKSPEAMESVFTHVFAPMNPDNFYQAYIDGKYRLPISLELASIGGEVRFYINLPEKLKNMFETQLYSQYPGIEVEQELLDYATELQWNPDEMDMISFHVVKKADSVFPIKTYIEFGHDRIPKEEEKFEPMAALIEFLGSAKPHERVYIQMICTPHAKKSFASGWLTPKGTWVTDAQAKINEMMGRDTKGQSTAEETESRPMLTMGERDTISAIERNTSKLAYEVGIRTMYVTMDKTQFNPGMIAPTFASFSQFNVIGRNELGPRWKTDFDYSWYEDRSGAKKIARKVDEIKQFKLRKYYAGEGKANDGHQPCIMSVEELATLYHIPGSSVLTPGLSRIPSVRREAPGNLPTGILPL